MTVINVKRFGRCAVCKHWYDPANSAITPRAPQIDLWEYDDSAKRKCMKKNFDTNASGFCSYFQSKF